MGLKIEEPAERLLENSWFSTADNSTGLLLDQASYPYSAEQEHEPPDRCVDCMWRVDLRGNEAEHAPRDNETQYKKYR